MPRAPAQAADQGMVPVMGILMLMPLIVVTVASAGLYLANVQDTLDAQADRAERAAWCAENPNQAWPGDGQCPEIEPRGYECEQLAEGEYLVCEAGEDEPALVEARAEITAELEGVDA